MRTLPCHNITCSRYIYFTENELQGKKTAGENAQQRHLLYPEGGKNTLTAQKREQHQKKRMKEARKDTGGNKPSLLTWKREGEMIQGGFCAPDSWGEMRNKRLHPHVSFHLNGLNVLQRLITMMYGHISLINEKAEQQQKGEKRLIRWEAIRIPADSIAYTFIPEFLENFDF